MSHQHHQHHQPPKHYGAVNQAVTDAAVVTADANVAVADVQAGRQTVAQKGVAALAAVNHKNADVDAAAALKKNNQLQAASIVLAGIGLLKFLPKIL